MKITIEGKEITLNGNQISFLNDKTGLDMVVIPRRLIFDIESGQISVQAVARDRSPTGVFVNEIQLGNVALDFEFTEFKSQEFQGKYLNSLFRYVMSRFGLEAHQVISEETGEVEVIREKPVEPEKPVYPDWVQPQGAHDAYSVGDVVQHKDKVWESILAANVWEPGLTGWRQKV